MTEVIKNTLQHQVTMRDNHPRDVFSRRTKVRAGNSFSDNQDLTDVDDSGSFGSGSSVSSDELDGDVLDIRQTAYRLAIYICSDKMPSGLRTDLAETMHRTTKQIMEKHHIIFENVISKLNINQDNVVSTFNSVATEMLGDRHINWGRIVTLYALGARLSKHFREIQDFETVEVIIELVTDFVCSDDLTLWISKNSGWDGFTEHFPPPDSMEQKIWRGLLCTAFGLGALAMIAGR